MFPCNDSAPSSQRCAQGCPASVPAERQSAANARMAAFHPGAPAPDQGQAVLTSPQPGFSLRPILCKRHRLNLGNGFDDRDTFRMCHPVFSLTNACATSFRLARSILICVSKHVHTPKKDLSRIERRNLPFANPTGGPVSPFGWFPNRPKPTR